MNRAHWSAETTRRVEEARQRAAFAARAQRLPGSRTHKAINELRAARRAARHVPEVVASLPDRLEARILATYVPEIIERGGETFIADKTRDAALRVIERNGRGLYLLGADGWRYYSRQTPSRYVSLRYLVGRDDNGPFAVRVPSTVGTIAGAIAALTPAAVTNATEAGKRVRRQGDIYAIETTRAHDAKAGWVDEARTHWFDADTRYLTHRPETGRRHRPVKLAYPVRFIGQRPYAMGRGGRPGSSGD